MIDLRADISEELYNDDVVSFIASRCLAIPRQAMKYFLVEEGIVFHSEADVGIFRLEENEMAILGDVVSGNYLQII